MVRRLRRSAALWAGTALSRAWAGWAQQASSSKRIAALAGRVMLGGNEASMRTAFLALPAKRKRATRKTGKGLQKQGWALLSVMALCSAVRGALLPAAFAEDLEFDLDGRELRTGATLPGGGRIRAP